MLLRKLRFVFALVVAAGVFRAETALAQLGPPPLLRLTSLEWLVADSDVIVRGTITDITVDQHWNIVTLDVLETLKGAKAERLKFVVHRLGDQDVGLDQLKNSKREVIWTLGLDQWKNSKREVMWILKRQGPSGVSESPDRDRVLARHKIDLHAVFLDGQPDEPAPPAFALGIAGAKLRLEPPSLLTVDLRTLKSSEEVVKAIRAAIAEFKDGTPLRSYSMALPEQVAERTGFGRPQNYLEVPADRRLEAVARRLVQSPGDFLAKDDPDLKMALRLEGVKALRLFPSEENLAIVRAWLNDPASTQPFKHDIKTTSADLVPALPKKQQSAVALPTELAQVPEIHFQQPLTKAMKTEDAQLHTAVTIDGVKLLNKKKTDAFIETLMKNRPDLAGLSFAMGDACRMKPEASKQFVAALDVFRYVESVPKVGTGPPPDPDEGIVRDYAVSAQEKKIDPSASVASLMQLLGHEDGEKCLALAKYLAGLSHIDATRALAKLAIFSAEAEVRTASVDALKKRDAKDYSEILAAGLKYPWPAVAERSSDAIAKLGRKELLPQLIDVLEKPDPRAPQNREKDGKKVAVVRELVRVNHHHNCLLCHAPANVPSEKEAASLEGLTAQVPVPSESMVAYYRPSVPDILVRFDVTYLRQDFSMKLRVANADPWPELQRYDFLVRTRQLTETEAAAYQKLLGEAASPYRRAALSALRELTGHDAEPTAAAWRKAAGL